MQIKKILYFMNLTGKKREYNVVIFLIEKKTSTLMFGVAFQTGLTNCF